MRRLFIAAALACALATAWSVPAAAQWFKYPTPGVPRTTTGAVNMAAPTPRTADGKPALVEKTPLSAWAFRIDATSKEPLPFQPWAAALRKERSDAHSANDPHAKCLPSNPPRAYTLPHYQEIIVDTDLIEEICLEGLKPLRLAPK